MKHQTINLVKFAALQRRLDLSRCFTIGVLEAIWIFAQTNARNGDLTRFSNEEIAAWMEWPYDADDLIYALVECGWVDRYDTNDPTKTGDEIDYTGHRGHDWDSHKPNWLRGVEARQLGGQLGRKQGRQPPFPSRPNLAQPKYDRSIGATSELDKIIITDEEYHGVKSEMNELRDALLGKGAKTTERDRDLIWKSVCFCHYQIKCPELIHQLTMSVKEQRPENPVAYFKTCLARKVERLGIDLNEEFSMISREEKQ